MERGKLLVQKRARDDQRNYWENILSSYAEQAQDKRVSLRAFSHSQGLVYAKLLYWYKRLNKKSASLKSVAPCKRRRSEKLTFIPVKLPKTPLEVAREVREPVELYYGKAYCLRIPSHIEVEQLVIILKALEQSHVDATVGA